jgi:hemoglobin-like flavoprotein
MAMEGQRLQPLTRRQIELLKKTFRLLDSDNLTKRFYTKLFIRFPEVKPLFPTELTELSTKLVSVFELVIHSFEERNPNEFHLQKAVIVPLRNLGKKHTEKGVEHAYYPYANDILVESMKEEIGYLFEGEAEDAWRLAFNHLTFAMLNQKADDASTESSGTIRDAFRYIQSIFKS